MAAKSVRKGLSPEEKTLIDNLKSMIAELESMEAGEAAGDDGVSGALKAIEGMAGTSPNEEQGGQQTPSLPAAQNKKLLGQAPIAKSNKGQGSTDTDVPPAQADADERIEELPEVDEENIGEVAKALQALMRRRGVGKSAGADPIFMVAKALQAISDRLATQETAVTELLKGMGIADQITLVEKEEQARRPVGVTDQEQVIGMVAKALVGALQSKVNEVTADDKKSLADVRKDLTSVLGAFGNSGLWNPVNGVFPKG